MLKRSLILMMMLIAFAACKSAKNGMPGCTGTGCGDVGDSQYSEYRYLAYMYNESTGAAFEAEALSGDMMSFYKTDIQKALNLLMSFGSTSGNASSSVSWYKTVPEEAKPYIEQANGDFTAGYANYLKSSQGKDFLAAQIDRAKARLDKIKAYADQIVNCTVTSTIDACTAAADNPFSAGAGANRDTTASLLDSEAVVKSVEVLAAAAFFIAGDTQTSLTLITDAVGFGSLFGGDSANAAILAKLDQIIGMLKDIQTSLTRIESKIDQLSTYVYYEDFRNAMTELDAIYTYLQEHAAYPNDIKTFLLSHFNATNSYNLLYEKAFNSSKTTLQANLNKVGQQKILGVYAKTNIDNPGYGQTTQEYSIDLPAKNLLIPLQDLQGFIRLSLARLELISQAFSGDELLQKRASFANTDISYLNQIKSQYNALFAKINTWAQSYNSLPFGFCQVTGGSEGVAIWVGKNVFADNNQSSSFYYYSNSLEYPIANYKNLGSNFVDFFIDKITDYSFIHNSFLNFLQKVPSYNGDLNKFKDYLVMYGTLLVKWEIELKAHIKAWETKK